MNPLTKTADFFEAFKKTVRANDSLVLRFLFDLWLKRHDCWKWENDFHFRMDDFGNSFLDSDCYAIEGLIVWEVMRWRKYWGGVATGELGINPRVLFELDAPQQSEQTSAEAPVS